MFSTISLSIVHPQDIGLPLRIEPNPVMARGLIDKKEIEPRGLTDEKEIERYGKNEIGPIKDGE